MTFDSAGALTKVKEILDGIPALQSVVVGVPSSLTNKVSAYIVLGGGPIQDFTSGGQQQAEIRVRIHFGYATDGDTSAAELAIAQIVDDFERAFFTARKEGGLLQDSNLDLSAGLAGEYVAYAGQEFRVFPLDVKIRQYETI